MGHFAAALFLVHALTQTGRCDDPQTQAEMNVCSAEAFVRKDNELNAVYRKALQSVDASRRPKLRAAQRAWLAYRDAQCEFEGSESEGGTMKPTLVNGCKTEVTAARIGQLRSELTAPR